MSYKGGRSTDASLSMYELHMYCLHWSRVLEAAMLWFARTSLSRQSSQPRPISWSIKACLVGALENLPAPGRSIQPQASKIGRLETLPGPGSFPRVRSKQTQVQPMLLIYCLRACTIIPLNSGTRPGCSTEYACCIKETPLIVLFHLEWFPRGHTTRGERV